MEAFNRKIWLSSPTMHGEELAYASETNRPLREVEGDDHTYLEKCKVSVIIPAYNAERYIEASMRSAMQQSFSDIEIIVVDDNSCDKTCAIVEKLAEEDHRIRLIRNCQNEGAAQARNKALDICKGEYVALLDCDDIWYSRKLEKQLEVAEREKADIVYCSYAIVDEHGEKKCNDFIVPPTTDLESTLAKSVISCSTALLNWRTIEKYRFPIGYYHEDLALWLQLLGDGMKAVGITEVLAEYRVRSNSRASNKISVAVRRWKIYRSMMKFSVAKSAYYFVQYAFAGIIKYRKQ